MKTLAENRFGMRTPTTPEKLFPISPLAGRTGHRSSRPSMNLVRTTSVGTRRRDGSPCAPGVARASGFGVWGITQNEYTRSNEATRTCSVDRSALASVKVPSRPNTSKRLRARFSLTWDSSAPVYSAPAREVGGVGAQAAQDDRPASRRRPPSVAGSRTRLRRLRNGMRQRTEAPS